VQHYCKLNALKFPQRKRKATQGKKNSKKTKRDNNGEKSMSEEYNLSNHYRIASKFVYVRTNILFSYTIVDYNVKMLMTVTWLVSGTAG